MTATLRAELLRLRRPRVIVGVGLIGVALAAAMTLLFWAALPATAPSDIDGGASRMPLSLEGLAQPGGLLAGYRFLGPQLAIIGLCLAVAAFANESRFGTWRNLAVRVPQRSRLLSGKLLAVLLVATAGTLVYAAGAGGMAVAMSAVRRVDVSAWLSADALVDTGRDVFAVAAATVLYTLIGATLGLVLRSTLLAVGMGLGWFFVGEPIVVLVMAARDLPTGWLPGQLCRNLSLGITAANIGALVVWLLALGAVSFYSFARRDIPCN